MNIKQHKSTYIIFVQGPVGNYAIMIAEEDGDIDTDLPGKVS